MVKSFGVPPRGSALEREAGAASIPAPLESWSWEGPRTRREPRGAGDGAPVVLTPRRVQLSCVSQEAPSLFSLQRGGATAAFASPRYLCQPPSKAARAGREMKVFDGIRGSEKELEGVGSCGRQGRRHPDPKALFLVSSVPLCQLSCWIGTNGQHQHSKGFVPGQAEDICSPLPPCIVTLSSLNMPWGFPSCYFSHVLLLRRLQFAGYTANTSRLCLPLAVFFNVISRCLTGASGIQRSSQERGSNKLTSLISEAFLSLCQGGDRGAGQQRRAEGVLLLGGCFVPDS